MEAYHFLKDDMTAENGNEPAWAVGEVRTFKGKVKLCESGYHSSPSWHDALQYAHGSMACIVEISKPVKQDETKYVSRKRRLISAKDASSVLRIWGCDCAERALLREEITDTVILDCIRVSRLYADGKATLEDLIAARSVTGNAGWDAARNAARYAAWDTACDAARSAASYATSYAARNAARNAARYAARNAALIAARNAAWDAAWDVARNAAWDAEIKWQRKHLDELMAKLFEE